MNVEEAGDLGEEGEQTVFVDLENSHFVNLPLVSSKTELLGWVSIVGLPEYTQDVL